MSEDKPLRFGFTKKIESKKLYDSALREDSTKDKYTPTDYLTHIKDNKIHGSVKTEEKKLLVIPPITSGGWLDKVKAKKSDVKQEISELGPITLEQRAAQELIADSIKAENEWKERDKLVEDIQVSEKGTEEPKVEESTLEDYENVPIGQFGMACLRGMGWKPGMGIGKNNKKDVALHEVKLRPKGLGLGANLKKTDMGVEDDVLLGRGVYVVITDGSKKGLSGKVEGLDDDGSRVVVKLESGESVTISSALLKTVKKKELNIINKEKYERVKSEIERENAETKSKKYKSSHQQNNTDSSWVYPRLRVRIINKDNRYYKHKVDIVDVISPTLCVCRTEEGRLLDEVETRHLETVIPRQDNSAVMILRGQYKRQIGRILERDRRNCVASVQLDSDSDIVKSYSYDDICEYLGGRL